MQHKGEFLITFSVNERTRSAFFSPQFFRMCLNEFAGFLSRYTLWLYFYIYFFVHTHCISSPFWSQQETESKMRDGWSGVRLGGGRWSSSSSSSQGVKRGMLMVGGGHSWWWPPVASATFFFIVFIFSLFIPWAPVMRRANVARRLRRPYLLMGEGLVSLRFSLAWQLRPGRL